MACCKRALAALLLLWTLVAAAAAAPAAAQRLEQAETVLWPDDGLPPDSAPWQAVALAHTWAVPTESLASNRWLRLRFELPQPPAALFAIYLPSLNRSVRLFINGQALATVGDFNEPMPLNWNHARLLTVPPALLHAGANTLLVQVRAYRFERGWLSSVSVGDEALLRPVFEQRRFWQNELVMMLGATVLVLSVLVFGVWLGRRDQAMYFWFACAMAVWSFISLDYFAERAPLPGEAWERAIEIAQVLHAVLIYVFVLRHGGRRAPRLEAALWLYWVAGALVVMLSARRTPWVETWYQGTLLASLYFLGLLVAQAWRQRHSEAVLLAVAASATIALSAYDLWLFSRHTWTDRLYLAHFGAPLFMGALGWVLMRRFVESLNAYERLNTVLEQRVADKGRALEANLGQLFEARRNAAVAVERARIMSEMHDGIGSQLTMALQLIDRGGGAPAQIAGVLRESIDDLQLIIDSLEPVERDLLTVLGTLRYRVQQRLQASGITVQWQVSDLPPLPSLTPQNVLAILRILQEAFANALKHSGARRIRVVTHLEGAGSAQEVACIQLADDGRGFSGQPRGRGLDSMRRRAAAMGAQLTIDAGAGGTTLTLRLPTGRTPSP